MVKPAEIDVYFAACERWDEYCSVRSAPLQRLVDCIAETGARQVEMPRDVWRAVAIHPEIQQRYPASKLLRFRGGWFERKVCEWLALRWLLREMERDLKVRIRIRRAGHVTIGCMRLHNVLDETREQR